MNKNMFLPVIAIVVFALCGLLSAEDSKEIGTEQVMRIKHELKDPFLTLLASSEFIDKEELEKRIYACKVALDAFKEEFEGKHAEPASAPEVHVETAAPAVPVVAPVVPTPTPAAVTASIPVPETAPPAPVPAPAPAPVVVSVPAPVVTPPAPAPEVHVEPVAPAVPVVAPAPAPVPATPVATPPAPVAAPVVTGMPVA